MYKVKDVARYIVQTAQEKGKPISNLKLQKLLYFLWKEYYKQTNKYLFKEPFVAWQFGPVERDVYFEYYMYGAAPIQIRPESISIIEIKDDDKRIIDRVFDDYAKETVFNLVQETHKQGCAWDRKFQNGSGARAEIPFDYIEEDIVQG